jgi:hypothetical protein
VNGQRSLSRCLHTTGSVVAPGTLGIILLVSGDPQEAVNVEACVRVVSRDRPRRVDAAGRGVCGARGIEGGQGTVGDSQEAVRPVSIYIVSRDRCLRGDAGGVSAFVQCGICASSGNVQRGEGPVALLS